MANSKEVPVGQLKPSSTWGEFNNISFVIQQAIAKLQTATLVRIDKCTNEGELSPVGFVDVTPMVNQIDGAGNPVPHVTIFNVPYFRLQGGKNGIIIDPSPGDIGIAVFASRDLTKVKATKKQGNPGSHRQYSFSDALYIGGVLNVQPEQYIQFNTSGIKVFSPAKILLEAPNIELKADTVEINASTVDINASSSVTMTTPIFTLNGEMETTGGITAAGEVSGVGILMSTHAHSGVTAGGDITGGPV